MTDCTQLVRQNNGRAAAKRKQSLRSARIVGDGGVVVDAWMLVHGGLQVVGRQQAVVRMFPCVVGGTDDLAVLHATAHE